MPATSPDTNVASATRTSGFCSIWFFARSLVICVMCTQARAPADCCIRRCAIAADGFASIELPPKIQSPRPRRKTNPSARSAGHVRPHPTMRSFDDRTTLDPRRSVSDTTSPLARRSTTAPTMWASPLSIFSTRPLDTPDAAASWRRVIPSNTRRRRTLLAGKQADRQPRSESDSCTKKPKTSFHEDTRVFDAFYTLFIGAFHDFLTRFSRSYDLFLRHLREDGHVPRILRLDARSMLRKRSNLQR